MLIPIQIPSMYNGPLPAAMALCTPDTRSSILALADDLAALGHQLRLSDLFRSHAKQLQSHNDWLTGRKQAYSPPPGGSLHEAGRAMDIDLTAIGLPLADFWKLAATRGFTPLINTPDSRLPEAWHFDCRGSHNLVHDYVRQGKAGSGLLPYRQMAASAILAAGGSVEGVQDPAVAVLQSGLIRLGYDPGPIDGILAKRTQSQLDRVDRSTTAAIAEIEQRLRAKWPAEFAAA